MPESMLDSVPGRSTLCWIAAALLAGLLLLLLAPLLLASRCSTCVTTACRCRARRLRLTTGVVPLLLLLPHV